MYLNVLAPSGGQLATLPIHPTQNEPPPNGIIYSCSPPFCLSWYFKYLNKTWFPELKQTYYLNLLRDGFSILSFWVSSVFHFLKFQVTFNPWHLIWRSASQRKKSQIDYFSFPLSFSLLVQTTLCLRECEWVECLASFVPLSIQSVSDWSLLGFVCASLYPTAGKNKTSFTITIQTQVFTQNKMAA